MDTKSAGIGPHGVAASEPATPVAEGVPGGRPASAAADGDAACTPDASPGSASSGSSDPRAGAGGTAPSPALPRMTPEAALRSALGLCDYLMRHWSGPLQVGAMPSVSSTRDEIILGLLACGSGEQEAPPRPTVLADAHARLRALAAGHGSTSLGLTVWDHENQNNPGWTRKHEWTSSVFARGSCDRILAHGRADGPGELLAQIAAALAVYDTPDCEPDVVVLGELPKVTT